MRPGHHVETLHALRDTCCNYRIRCHCASCSPTMEVLRSDEALSQAADAVQCMVCQRTVEAAWQVRRRNLSSMIGFASCPVMREWTGAKECVLDAQGLLQWLLRGPGQKVSRTQLRRYLLDTCHWEASSLPRQCVRA